MSTKCITDVSQYVKVEQCTNSEIMDVVKKKEHVSGAKRERGSGKSGEQEWSGEREAVEREQSKERVSQK